MPEKQVDTETLRPFAKSPNSVSGDMTEKFKMRSMASRHQAKESSTFLHVTEGPAERNDFALMTGVVGCSLPMSGGMLRATAATAFRLNHENAWAAKHRTLTQ